MHSSSRAHDHSSVAAVQAVDAAVAAAVADARVKTKEEVEAASAAKKAAADQQLLRELEDKTEALTSQVNAATEQLRSTETALRCVICADMFLWYVAAKSVCLTTVHECCMMCYKS